MNQSQWPLALETGNWKPLSLSLSAIQKREILTDQLTSLQPLLLLLARNFSSILLIVHKSKSSQSPAAGLRLIGQPKGELMMLIGHE